MSILSINTFPETPLYSFRTVLDGQEFVLRFDYNGRNDRWYVSLKTPAGVPLASGVKINVGVALFRKYVDLSLPKGQLMGSTLTPNDEMAGFGELAEKERVTLLYFEEADVKEALGL